MGRKVISIENVSKIYQLGEIGTGTLSSDVNRWWVTKVLGKEDPYLKIGQVNDRTSKGESDLVYSLKDVSFEVEQGQVLGIIGKNGAGKSTLLKILSRITSPTTGRVRMKGRVASLLEVGTGFHPELTGRENIFLNGSILGMRKHEIARKLDEIIDFSGVERYIDTPVKRYSSGMYVRLAFAVAAHLESEILIVDEVLAVGDAEFQKKCLGKLESLSLSCHRTILFVSHQLGSIKQLCTNALLLNNGHIEKMGAPEIVINHYLSIVHSNKVDHFESTDSVDHLQYFLKRFSTSFSDGKFDFVFGLHNQILINLSFGYTEVNLGVEFAIAVFDINDVKVLTIHEPLFKSKQTTPNGYIDFKVELPDHYLAPGEYYFNIAVHIPHVQLFHLVERVNKITVIDSGSSFSGYTGANIGVVMPKYKLIN